MMSIMDNLHNFWSKKDIASSCTYPKIVGFYNAFKTISKKDIDPVFSIGEIELPFAVSKTVSIKRVGDHGRSRTDYSELTALEN